MKGTPDNTVILHWDECHTAWMELPWQEWVRFRGFGRGRRRRRGQPAPKLASITSLSVYLEMAASSPT